ncbi:MAG: hypothetical protein ACRDTE_01245 [Pseudonocardiaceae bacterium]
MEANEGDPDALARLYQLDYLAARLRRNAENLRVLAGQDVGSAASAASAPPVLTRRSPAGSSTGSPIRPTSSTGSSTRTRQAGISPR